MNPIKFISFLAFILIVACAILIVYPIHTSAKVVKVVEPDVLIFVEEVNVPHWGGVLQKVYDRNNGVVCYIVNEGTNPSISCIK